MIDDEENRVEEIGLWFRERGRKLLVKEVPDGWEAIYPVHIPNVAVVAPGSFGRRGFKPLRTPSRSTSPRRIYTAVMPT
jgi:hypothetical protein